MAASSTTQDGSAEAGVAARLQLRRRSCAARARRQAAATAAARGFAPWQPPLRTCAPASGLHVCHYDICDETLLSGNHMQHGLGERVQPDHRPAHTMCQLMNAGGSLAGGFGGVQGSAAGSAQQHSIRAHRPQAWRQQQVCTRLLMRSVGVLHAHVMSALARSPVSQPECTHD